MSTGMFSDCMFRFYFHMVGYHIGTLRIKTRDCVGCVEHVWWSTDTAAVDNWIRMRVPLYSLKPFEVSFSSVLNFR